MEENDSTLINFGIDFLETEIDDVIFQTNEFLTDSTFIQSGGSFWYLLQMSLALSALFAIIVVAGMAYKMMIKREPIDVMKLMKPMIISIVLCWWYPPSETGMGGGSNSTDCVLDVLAYIPNCIGSYTHDLYEAEATQVQDRFEDVQRLMYTRDTMYQVPAANTEAAHAAVTNAQTSEAANNSTGTDATVEAETQITKAWMITTSAGSVIFFDKIIMFIALITYRIGWWGTIYCQQILLGMLTIFGPIQWAFSLLPKWESSWAKWITRYLTVHFYGAMLYLVGFYVLLLFDIVINIQYNDLSAITQDSQTMAEYIKNGFFSCGYLMAASIVALKCLNLVPDLAAWMIPEGETAFSTRNFGEGVATQMRGDITGMTRKII